MNYERVTVKCNDKKLSELLIKKYSEKRFLIEVKGNEISLRNKLGSTIKDLTDFSIKEKDLKVLAVFSFEHEHYEKLYTIEVCNGKYEVLDE